MIKALIFDFDGLILETEGPIYQSWQELYESYGSYLPFSTWATVIGTMDSPFDPLALLEEQLGYSLDPDEIVSKRLVRELELTAKQPILPGVHEYISDSQRLGLKLGLASSSDCEWVTGHLERLELISYFDCIRTSDDVELTKPDPAVYLSVLSGLNLSPNQAIALEDSPLGALAAKRAGLYCVAVPNEMTQDLPLDHADMRLDSLADLPLEALLSKVEQLK